MSGYELLVYLILGLTGLQGVILAAAAMKQSIEAHAEPVHSGS